MNYLAVADKCYSAGEEFMTVRARVLRFVRMIGVDVSLQVALLICLVSAVRIWTLGLDFCAVWMLSIPMKLQVGLAGQHRIAVRTFILGSRRRFPGEHCSRVASWLQTCGVAGDRRRQEVWL